LGVVCFTGPYFPAIYPHIIFTIAPLPTKFSI